MYIKIRNKIEIIKKNCLNLLQFLNFELFEVLQILLW